MLPNERSGASAQPPRRVAASLSDWLMRLFDAYALTGKPFGEDLADETPPELYPEGLLRSS